VSDDRLGLLRLVLLFPLFLVLVVIDEEGRWAALALYLVHALSGPVARRLDPAAATRTPSPLRIVAWPLLTLTTIAGLAAGGAVLSGPVGAGAIVVGRELIGLARPDGRARAIAAPDRTELALRLATALAFVLIIAPFIPGLSPAFDIHRLGGWLFMACGGFALVKVVLEIRTDQGRSTKTGE